MSNLQNLEPQAFGCITFKTTFGDIDIELFTKQCPKATRNFVQLCLDEYYKDTIFERVEKDFIAVGGQLNDSAHLNSTPPDGTFPDEFNSRLRFTRRGLLATANTKKNENGPKFFFTLGPTPELQNKHTIFGRVIGNSVFSLTDLNERQVDEDCRPYSEAKILDVLVKENPYPDVFPRARESISNRYVDGESSSESDDPLSRPKPDPSRSKKLSFYPDEDDDNDDDENETEKDKQQLVRESAKRDRDEIDSAPTIDLKSNITNRVSIDQTTEDLSEEHELKEESRETKEGTLLSDDSDAKEKRMREIRAQIERIKQQIESGIDTKTRSRRNKEEEKETKKNPPPPIGSVDDSDSIELRIASKKNRNRERETIELVTNFKKKLKEASSKASQDHSNVSYHRSHKDHRDSGELEDLDKVDGDDWMKHKFVSDDD